MKVKYQVRSFLQKTGLTQKTPKLKKPTGLIIIQESWVTFQPWDDNLQEVDHLWRSW